LIDNFQQQTFLPHVVVVSVNFEYIPWLVLPAITSSKVSQASALFLLSQILCLDVSVNIRGLKKRLKMNKLLTCPDQRRDASTLYSFVVVFIAAPTTSFPDEGRFIFLLFASENAV
jgi:hypothetical protein